MKSFVQRFLVAGVAIVLPPVLLAQAPPVKAPPASIIMTNGPAGQAKNGAPYLSSGVSDVVRMFQAGVEEPVILAFIQSSSVPYHPSAKEVIYLRDLGVPQALITALLKRGGELRDRAAEVEREERNRTPPPAPAPAQPSTQAPATATAPTQQVQPTVTYTTTPSYPTYVANPTYVSYPASYSYAYPAYYGGYGYSGGYYGGCRYPYYGYGGYGYGGYGCGYRYPSYGISLGFSYGSRCGYGGYGYYGGYRGGYGGGIRYVGGHCR